MAYHVVCCICQGCLVADVSWLARHPPRRIEAFRIDRFTGVIDNLLHIKHTQYKKFVSLMISVQQVQSKLPE